MLALWAVPFSACGGTPSETGKVDNTKTTLWVNNYDGGYGDAWLSDTIARFETAYADYQGVDGKVGVQVKINPIEQKGTELIGTLSGSTDDIYFSENMNYNELVSMKGALDISDIVKATGSDNKTIQSKLTQDYEDYLNKGGEADKGVYYALPHYEVTGGIVYNINLFEANNWYFNESGKTFVRSDTEKRSKGPDNKPGTYDDGLPATYDDFFKLCDKIVDSICTPFIWSGTYGKAYWGYVLENAYADYEGYEQIMLNYTLKGTATNLVEKINDDGTVVLQDPTPITGENGWKLYQQAGKYHALDFMDRALSNSSYYDTRVTNPNHDNTTAEYDFIASPYENGVKPVAMLIEGAYWYNEIDDFGGFKRLESSFGVEKEDLKYGLMPMPKVDGKLGTEQVATTMMDALCFINANIKKEKIDIAKKFVQFCYTDAEMQAFTIKTNTFKSMNYSLEGRQNELSNFGKELFKHKESSKIIHKCSGNDFFQIDKDMFSLSFETSTYKYPFTAVFDYKKSAKEYFELIKEDSLYSEATWNKVFKDIL